VKVIARHVKVSQSAHTGWLTRVGSPRTGLKMSASNPTHFMVSQNFCYPAQPTTSWWL